MDWSNEESGAGTGAALAYGARWWIGAGNNRLRYRIQRVGTDFPDLDTGPREVTVPVGFYGEEVLEEIQTLLRADFSAAGAGELRVICKMLGSWLGFPILHTYLDYTAGVGGPGIAYVHFYSAGNSIMRTLGWVSHEDEEVVYTPGATSTTEHLRGTVSGRAYHLGPYSTAIPVIFPGALVDWSGPGFARVAPPGTGGEGEAKGKAEGELVYFEEVVATGILTPEGWEVHELHGVLRGQGGTTPQEIVHLWMSVSQELPKRAVDSVYLIDAGDVFQAVGQLLTGLGEAGVNGPYSANPGLGLYDFMVDTDELLRLSGLPTTTGPRLQVLESSTQVSEWIASNLAVEGFILTPGWVGNSHRLTVRRMGAPGPSSRIWAAEVDYHRPVNAPGGLSWVVNRLTFEAEGGKVTHHDLPSQRTLRITQGKTLKVGLRPTVEGLLLIASSAARLFSLFGRPTERVETALDPTSRGLLPGDFVHLTLGKSGKSGIWIVLSAAPCWIPGSEAQRVLLQLLPELEGGWYAPSAKVAEVLDGTRLRLEEAEYSTGMSKIDPSLPARDIHYLYPLSEIYAFPDGDYTAGIQVRLDAVDWESSVATVTSTAGILKDWIIRCAPRASVSAEVMADYIYLAPPGSIYHEWTD